MFHKEILNILDLSTLEVVTSIIDPMAKDVLQSMRVTSNNKLSWFPIVDARKASITTVTSNENEQNSPKKVIAFFRFLSLILFVPRRRFGIYDERILRK